jgi:hypothetical protein
VRVPERNVPHVSSVHVPASGHPETRPQGTGVTIERDAHAQQFVIIANRVARDRRLHRSDRGLLVEILSLPPNTRISADTLADNGPEGRDAVRSMLRRLEAAGYVVRQKVQDDRGHWSTRLIVRETPVENPEPTTGFQSSVPPAETPIVPGRTDDGFPVVGFPGAKDLKDEDLKNDHHQTRPPVDNCGETPAPAPDDDLIGDVRRDVKIQHGADITDAEARHLIAEWRKRAELPPHTVKPLRWYKTCVANESNILALLPARPATPQPPRGTCGQCDPRTAWLLDDHGYPDPSRPCSTCRACKARVAA